MVGLPYHEDDDADVVCLGGDRHARDEEQRDEIRNSIEDAEVANASVLPLVAKERVGGGGW